MVKNIVNTKRIEGVDLFRVLAIFAVIVIHTKPFENNLEPIGYQFDLATVLNQLARFAVPFFFTISGYFWAKKVKNNTILFQSTISSIKRIFFLFVIWSLIYLIPWDLSSSLQLGAGVFVRIIYWKILASLGDMLKLFFWGTESHLWYLMALVCSICISAFFIHFRRFDLLRILAILLYIVGVCGQSYSATPIGFYSLFGFRYGPFFSLIFFVTGIYMANYKRAKNWFFIGVILLVAGIVMHFTELYFLNKIWGISIAQGYVFGTYLFGVGVVFIALSDMDFSNLGYIASIGPYVLGMYLSHFIFIDLLKPINRLSEGNVAWSFFYPVIVFTLSYIISRGLSKNKITKLLVC